MNKPAFDPTQPFTLESAEVSADRPAFDASQPFTTAPPRKQFKSDEASPDISFLERFVAKNFANSLEAQAAYLKKKRPELDVTIKNNNVYIKRPEEAAYRPLDPSSFELADITDIATDVLQGVGETAGSVAGGVAAGLPTGGAGMIPGAMAGGALTGAGLETLRQGIGKALGVPQDFSGAQIGASAVGGALSPLLFGSGALAADVAGKTLAGKVGRSLSPALKAVPGVKTLAPEAVEGGIEQAMLQSGRGLVGRGWEKFRGSTAEKLGEYFSGVPRRALRAFKEDPAAAARIEAKTLPAHVGVSPSDPLWKESIRGGEWAKANASMQRVGQEISGMYQHFDTLHPEGVDVTSLRGKLDKLTDLLAPQELPKLQAGIDRVAMSASEVQRLKQTLTPFADFDQKSAAEFTRAGANMTPAQRESLFAARELYSDLSEVAKKELAQSARANPDAWQQFPSSIGEVNAKYREMSDNFSELRKILKNENTAISRMVGAAKDPVKRDRMKKIDGALGTGMVKHSDDLLQYGTLFQNYVPALSSGGATSTSRTGVAGGLGAGLGAAVGYWSGGGALGGALGASLGAPAGIMLGGPPAMKRYLRAGVGMDNIQKYLTQPEVRRGFMRNVPASATKPQTLINIMRNLGGEE